MTLANLWLPVLGASQQNPLRGFVTAYQNPSNTLTTPSLSYLGNDLLLGVGFQLGTPGAFNTAGSLMPELR